MNFAGGRKAKTDLNASLNRFLELKRDPTSRVKHLKLLLEAIPTPQERSTLLEECSFEVFHLLLELLSSAEQGSQPVAAKNPSAIEVEFSLWTLEQIFIYLPSLVSHGWQFASIEQCLKKCLFPQNLMALRKIAMRLFLLWFQILGSANNAPSELDTIFVCLLPNFPVKQGDAEKELEYYCGFVIESPESPFPVKMTPLAPQGEKPAEQEVTAKRKCQKLQNYIEKFFDYMTRETGKLEWRSDKVENQRKCLEFLFEKLKKLFLPACFPNGNQATVDIYGKGCWDFDKIAIRPLVIDPQSDAVMVCRYWMIRLVAHYAYSYKHYTDSLNNTQTESHNQEMLQQGSPEKKVSFQIQTETKLPASYEVMRGVLLGSRENINATISLVREGLLVPLQCGSILNRVFRILREWIFMYEMPPFMLEPDSGPLAVGSQVSQQTLLNVLISFYFNPAVLGDSDKTAVAVTVSHKIMGLLKDLANPQRTPLLQFSHDTWTVYLECLLTVVCHVVPPRPPRVAEQRSFSQEVATSMFQALLISWIFVTGVRGVGVSEGLWDKLHATLSERTAWPELIEEWSKVLESVTRALGVNFYGVDLLDLPLERLSEQKIIKKGLASRSRIGAKQPPPNSLALSEKSKSQYDFCGPTPTATPAHGDIPFNVSEPNFNQSGGAGDYDFQTPPQSAPPVVAAAGGDIANHAPSWHGHNKLEVDAIPSPSDGVSHSSDTASVDSNGLGILSTTDQDHLHAHSPMFTSAYDRESMTPSPVPSNGGELDDSVDDYDLAPEPMDSAEVDLTPRDTDPDTSPNSSLNWVQVWRRVLGCLGDINHIDSPANHCAAVRAVTKTVQSLLKVRQNQGLPLDGQVSTQSLPFVPPFLWLAPWLLAVLKKPADFGASRELALGSVCNIILGQQDMHIDPGLVAQFAATAKDVLKEQDILASVVLDALSPSILYERVPGLGPVLIRDCLSTAQALADSGKQSIKALQLAACLSAYEHPVIDNAPGLREDAVGVLLTAAKLRTMEYKMKGLTLNGLSVYVFDETARLGAGSTKKILNDAFNALLNELMSEDDFRLGLQVAENLHSLLSLLPNVVSGSEKECPFMVKLLLELYCNQLESLSADVSAVELSIRLMLDLCEFSLKVPVHLMTTHAGTHTPPLFWVLRALSTCCTSADVIPQLRVTAKALLPMLVKNFAQSPLPQFSLAQVNCFDSFLEGKKTLDPSWIITGEEDRAIWALDNREKDCQFVVRSLPGKDCWGLTEHSEEGMNPPNDIETALNSLIQKLDTSGPSASHRRLSKTDSRTHQSLNQLCAHLAKSSPECLPHPRFPEPAVDDSLPEEQEITQAMHQLNLKIEAPLSLPNPSYPAPKELKPWRNLLGDLGLGLWENRGGLTQLDTEDLGRISRELRHLDGLFCREVHKMAVIYVAEGQEDKKSIMANKIGSRSFEDFVARLGWEVDLTNHPGYQGGLPAEGSTPYFATANSEVIFHVSTRMHYDDITKTRHLGNDEIFIVWSEHFRDYRRSIIKTEFCDVLIVVYPLPNKLYRIQIESMYGLSFGPLFDGAIVNGYSLAPLVRATAINASRAKRRSADGWQHWDAHRQTVLQNCLRNLEKTSLFKDLLVNVVRPGNKCT